MIHILIVLIFTTVLVCGFRFFSKKNNKLEEEKNKLEKEKGELREKNILSEAQKTHLEKQIQEYKNLQDNVKLEFKNLANEIFENKSKTFSETSKKDIDSILKPLETKINDFQKGVEGRQQQIFSLKDEVRNLVTTKESLAKETQSLTKALRSDVKKQGLWGELKLEKTLERSGLEKGKEYIVQGKDLGLKTSDGRVQKPDVIVNLPDDKQIVIDSKVSLDPYLDFINNENEKDKQSNKLLESVRRHIDELNRKEYQSNEKLISPEFVFLFFPLEGALSLVMDINVPHQSKNLWDYAWDKSVVLVTPSNLMATLKIINSIWRIDKQNKNAQKIAEESGNLYDKFVGFLEDIGDIGKRIEQAQKSYSDAENKLKTGRGNIISKAERIKELGAKVTKNIPEHWKADSLMESENE